MEAVDVFPTRNVFMAYVVLKKIRNQGDQQDIPTEFKQNRSMFFQHSQEWTKCSYTCTAYFSVLVQFTVSYNFVRLNHYSLFLCHVAGIALCIKQYCCAENMRILICVDTIKLSPSGENCQSFRRIVWKPKICNRNVRIRCWFLF